MSLIQSAISSSASTLGGFAGTALQSGRTGGAQLLPDMSSVLSDAAEELTQSLSGKAQEKSLKERKPDRGQGMAQLSRAQRQAMLQAMGQGAGQGRAGAGQQAQSLAGKALRQPGQVRREARQMGGDASQQYLSLLEAADLLDDGQAGSDPGGQGRQALREAAAELLAENGREIRADINTFEATRPLSPEEAGQFRSAYRDVVLGESAVSGTLRRLLDMLPKGQSADYARVLEATRQALGLDLAASQPSADPVRLRTLMTDLSHLLVISTVIDSCQELSQSLTERHQLPGFSATAMTSELLALTSDRWVDASRFGSICKRFDMHEPLEAAVHFLTGARHAIRDMPVQVFTSMEARQSLLEAAQAALDEAIDREEGLI